MNRRTVSVLTFTLLTLAVVLGPAFAGGPATTRIVTVATPATVDVDLPSDSTGVPSGTLALRIHAPPSATDARYSDGAPVVVYAVGGTSAGSLRTQQLSLADDVIRIFFLFPGGTDLGRSSDGTYDYRGPNSIAALRDVILYAAGELTDSLGRTIDEVVPVPVLHDEIGLVGSSNGGNIVIAVAAQHDTDPSAGDVLSLSKGSGQSLASHLQYIIQWESPVSSQIATAELGPVTLDCQGSDPEHLFTENPRYLSYGSPEVELDYSQLTYDPGSTRHPLFWDGNGDGRYTTIVDPNTNCRTPDLDFVYFAAAIHEMADRAHAAGHAPSPTSTQTATPTMSPSATVTPTDTQTPTATPSPSATPTLTPIATPSVSQCVGDVNGNGVGDVMDIMATASDLLCHVYLPLVAANWRQPWPPAPPAQPSDGPGGSDYAHSNYSVVVRGLGDRKHWIYQPAEPQPAQAPVVVFLHGWGVLSPEPYLFWLEHLVRKGNIVIYPRYQASWLTPPETFTDNAIDAVRDALDWLERDPGRVQPERARFAILGHSYGGAITVNMAHRWQSAGLPQPRAIMPVQPGTEDGGIDNIDNLSDIPSTVLMNCHVGADDEAAGRAVCDIIWDRTSHIPAANRDYVVMYSDPYGEPDLDADHRAPAGGPDIEEVDALDWYGFWKDFDALRDCAFYGTNCAYGVGDTPEHRFMGFWSDGVLVRQLQITDVKP